MLSRAEATEQSVSGEPDQPADFKPASSRRSISPTGVQVIAITIVAALMFLTFSIFAAHFDSVSNMETMAQVSSYTFIVAAGLTFLFVAAEIDLSLGANLAFSGVIMGLCITNWGLNPWIGALCAVCAGLIIGLINGIVVTVIGVQSFIVTLGMLSVLGGAALVITGGLPIDYPQNLKSSLIPITNGTIDGFPVPILWAAGVFLVCLFLLRYTKFGYHVYAVGGNPGAAREMGVNVRMIKLLCFVLTGGLCALTAVLESNWLQEADPGAGSTFTLQTIAAIIIGGVALYGGAGSIYGSLVGTVITGMLGTGLVLLGLNANWPELVEGLIIIVVVTIGISINKRAWTGRRSRPLRTHDIQRVGSTEPDRPLVGFGRTQGTEGLQVPDRPLPGGPRPSASEQ
jgi:ribose transport system permease protein